MDTTEITLNRALELYALHSPNKTFITHQRATYSFKQTHDLVNRVATTLKNNGVRQGDPVCLMLPRVPELIIAFLAATRIGALPAPVNYLLCSNDVINFVKQISPKAIFSDTRILSSEINTALTETETLLRIDTNNKKENWVNWSTAVIAEPYTEKDGFQSTDVAYLNFTTGTSGQPKGALATHANIYWNTRSAIKALSLTAEDVHLCMFASFAHPHELFARSLYTGASVILLEEINPKTIVNTINQHSITCMMGLAPMYEMMVNHCGSMTMPSLRIAESGGMYTRQAINEEFLRQFGIPILSVWGSTETTGIALANRDTDYQTNGSMGKVCPYYQVKLMDDNNSEVAAGEIGELFFKGPGIVKGYDDHTCILDENGWYASGDIATMDNKGFYSFIERKSGMIKVTGLKVYPLQVELILLDHPKIAEIAVLGIPDRRKGNIPKAFVVPVEGKHLDSDDIVNFCKGKIPPYMIPKQFEIMEDLPKIGSGKINKKALVKSLFL